MYFNVALSGVIVAFFVSLTSFVGYQYGHTKAQAAAKQAALEALDQTSCFVDVGPRRVKGLCISVEDKTVILTDQNTMCWVSASSVQPEKTKLRKDYNYEGVARVAARGGIRACSLSDGLHRNNK